MRKGYTLHEKLCSKCDMPMMKCNNVIECVICPKEVPMKEEAKEEVKSSESSEMDSALTVPDAEAPKTDTTVSIHIFSSVFHDVLCVFS